MLYIEIFRSKNSGSCSKLAMLETKINNQTITFDQKS